MRLWFANYYFGATIEVQKNSLTMHYFTIGKIYLTLLSVQVGPARLRVRDSSHFQAEGEDCAWMLLKSSFFYFFSQTGVFAKR